MHWNIPAHACICMCSACMCLCMLVRAWHRFACLYIVPHASVCLHSLRFACIRLSKLAHADSWTCLCMLECVCTSVCILLNASTCLCMPVCACMHSYVGGPWGLTNGFAMDLVLNCLRIWPWTALSSDGQICNGFGIELFKTLALDSLELRRTDLQWIWYWIAYEFDLGEPWALTDRFAMDLVLNCLRIWPSTAWSSDGQNCNGFAIELLKNLTLDSLELWWTDLQ